MRKPTPSQFAAEHKLLWENPEKYVAMMTGFIQENPGDPSEYFSRAQGWEQLKQFENALDDLDKSLALDDRYLPHLARGQLLCRMGRYREALEDFNRSEEIDPEKWLDAWGPLHRADCHAHLGNEAAALADCARLADDFWSPGIYGEPRGNKAEVTAEIRRRARAAKGSAPE